ncbi:MAG: radical SAM protein [Candidatus Bathyarchaeota archaeon]
MAKEKVEDTTVQSIEVLKSTINRKSIRYLLKKFSSKCKKDGKSRVEVALELFANKRSKACWTCSKIVYPLVRWTIKKGGEAFGLNELKIKEKFENVYWRKGLINVLQGISRFGVKRPFVPGAPFLVVWNFTQLCNLHCKHCYASAGLPSIGELNTNEALKVVDKLADAGVTILAFSGGEPLIRKDFFQVLERANSYGIFTAVATNGTLLSKDTVKRLKHEGIGYVQISLDGAKPETHENFRGVPGVFEKAINGIKNCVEEGIFVEVATTATKLNYLEILEIVNLCGKLDVDWWMMYNFVPTGRGRFIIENDLSPEEREKLLESLWFKLRSNIKPDVLSTAPQYARVALQTEEKLEKKAKEELIIPTHFYNPHLYGQLVDLSEFIGGCGAGRFYCAIEHDGSITPCVFFPLKVGEILKDNFEEIWEKNKVFQELRNREVLKPNCGVCKFKYVCGGCRARAYGYFGDYLAPDPGCIRNKELWEKLVCQVQTR